MGPRLRRQGDAAPVYASEDAKRMVAEQQQQELANQRNVEPLNAINQDVFDDNLSGSQLLPHLSSTQLSQMMQDESRPTILSQQQGPLPEPDFIMSNRPIARPAPLTTCTKQGKAAAAKNRKATKNTGAASRKKNTATKSGTA